MRILIAPDKFKGALEAPGVTGAIAEGVREAAPSATIDCCPMADGGDGTGEVLAAVRGFVAIACEVLDPLGRPTVARWWRSPDGARAIIELAEAIGLARLNPADRDPFRTSSYGVGQLLAAALRAGVSSVELAAGGSATVDGGAGCLQALGVEFRDASGNLLAAPLAGGDLIRIRSFSTPKTHFALTVLCDVDNPLLGPQGAAAVFGPQKGADAAGVTALETGLAHWARLLRSATGTDVGRTAYGGAAGGIAASLHALLHARLEAGARVVADAVDLSNRLRGCALCLTGEGRIDAQTRSGKVVYEVAQRARAAGVPCVALVGSAQPDDAAGLTALARMLALQEVRVITPKGVPVACALLQTPENLRAAASAVVRKSGL